MCYPNRKRKDILDHVLDINEVANKKQKVFPSSSQSSTISSGSFTSVQTNQWLPPISSLLTPLYYNQVKSIPPASSVHLLPMIPYFFHHKQFGLEACMNQLEYSRQYHNHRLLNDHHRFYPF